MRVLFVYKYLTLGGVEAVLRARLEELGSWGIEAYAWFFHDLGGREMFAGLADRIYVGDVQACADRVGDGTFDLVSSIDTEEIFPCLVGGRGVPPLVVEAHSAYPPSLGYLAGLRELRPAVVLVPSRHHGDQVRERVGPGVEIRVVPNPVHPAFLAEPGSPAGVPVRPVLAWIGRLDDFKNWPAFLEIAASLLGRGVDLEAWIVGRPVGPGGAEALIQEARRTAVLDRLRWFRGLPHSSMPNLFDAVRDSGGAVVTTSRGESFGLTIAEAMARRCAVVVPRQGPFEELVQHERSGLCYDPGSVESAIGQVVRLLADRRLRERCGEEGREAIVAGHSPGPAVGRLAGELARVTGRDLRSSVGWLAAGQAPRWKPVGSAAGPAA